MNILIITTYFPPDSAIAAVRPYMFAKYLTRLGHKITVLRSGELSKNPDRTFPPLDGVHVVSFLGDSSPAEVFTRGKENTLQVITGSRIFFLPSRIRQPISRIYHACMAPLESYRWLNKRKKIMLPQQKGALNRLMENGAKFDIVFATYGDLENVYAGEFASTLFNCPWILDLRDPIPRPIPFGGFLRSRLMQLQDRAVRKADACTVISNGIRKSSPGLQNSRKVFTIYNGYEPFQNNGGGEVEQGTFSICYTGTLYAGRSNVTPLLQALQWLSHKEKVDLNKVRIDYAGPDFQHMQAYAETLGMKSCLVDHGYVTRTEASRLQKSSDIFLLLSWNTKKDQGRLSGKFYEGIRCGRPILALVSGNEPDSELYQLNQKYHYGFCYEDACRQKHFPLLCEFLHRAYIQKMKQGAVKYTPSEDLATAFRYDTLTRELETVFERLTSEKV